MNRRSTRAALAALLVSGLLGGCGGGEGDDDTGEPPVFPEDFAATYQEVRNCRFSLEHDLTRMRVLAAPDAMGTYQMRNAPFAAGAVVLKIQYDSADTTCSGPILHYTVMQKLDAGASPDTLDWAWQKVSKDFKVDAKMDVQRCVRCHTNCGKPPEGFDATCAVP